MAHEPTLAPTFEDVLLKPAYSEVLLAGADVSTQLIKNKAFTLIELSLVLVIIGLIVGGAFVGKDIIRAGKERAQIAQLEKYSSAVNAFKLKYNCLPGDCKTAANFGFPARGTAAGAGNGNGIIEGNWGASAANNMGSSQNGENTMFWVDLSMAGLIPETFNTASCTTTWGNFDTTNLYQVFPRSKIFDDIYVYTFSVSPTNQGGESYFGLDAITGLSNSTNGIGLGNITSRQHTIPVSSAYNIDTKIDDGAPLTGKVTPQYEATGGSFTNYFTWVGTASASVAVAASTTTCYDNQNSTANAVTYSTSVNSGLGRNCSLAIKW